MFSNRLGSLEENALWRALARKRASGDSVFNLTESNPTRVGIDYPGEAILEALSQAEALEYQPDPRGLLSTREAIARYYDERGVAVSPNNIVLTASTSEAYSFLFKLLCNPGEAVAVPRPSYPLFDSLAALDSVVTTPYSPHELPSPATRAVIAVHPNNPTGEYVADEHAARLARFSEDNDVPLIVDEVFLDYPIRRAPARSFAGADRGLVFISSGLSKLAALPQMKLSWIVIAGAPARVDEARLRLEHIADAFLSVGAPVQLAASQLLALGAALRTQLHARIGENLVALERAVDSVPEVTLPIPEAGWYAVVRLPAIMSSDAWALEILERASVYVHPGSFFGFATGAHVVVSLLPRNPTFADAMRKLLDVVADRINSPGE